MGYAIINAIVKHKSIRCSEKINLKEAFLSTMKRADPLSLKVWMILHPFQGNYIYLGYSLFLVIKFYFTSE